MVDQFKGESEDGRGAHLEGGLLREAVPAVPAVSHVSTRWNGNMDRLAVRPHHQYELLGVRRLWRTCC